MSEWISVYDQLPKIDKRYIVGNEKNADGDIKTIGEDVFHCVTFHPFRPCVYCWMINHTGVTHYKEIAEKRPDFSKLKNGDFIHVEWQYENRVLVRMSIGKFDEIDSCGFFIIKSSDCCRFHIKINDIKKITRINLEEKIFEEI